MNSVINKLNKRIKDLTINIPIRFQTAVVIDSRTYFQVNFYLSRYRYNRKIAVNYT